MPSVKQIKDVLAWQDKVHRKEYSRQRAESALDEARRWLQDMGVSDDTRHQRAMENIEAAEAWIAYLQDPGIIDIEPERNLPA